MATVVKEKRRQKKKCKEKKSASLSEDEQSLSGAASNNEDRAKVSESFKQEVLEAISEVTCDVSIQNMEQQADFKILYKKQSSSSKNETTNKVPIDLARSQDLSTDRNKTEIDSFKNLNAKLAKMALSSQRSEIDGRMPGLENIDDLQPHSRNSDLKWSETATPSAPMFEEQIKPQAPIQEEILSENPKVKCMPLDEVIQLYGGTEMAAVRSMSEQEEAEVVAGPNCGPDHPLIDLLSTFRCSLRAMERERSRLASHFDDEEKFRSTLWKIEKRNIHLKEECKCGLTVHIKAMYEHAHLMKERLPVAKLKLEGLLKDIQESYCHHQHAALLAHYQIEEIVSETIKSNKTEIRNALTLILQALRLSDSGLEALPEALQRWAEILARALIHDLELRHLLFVMHQLFRQTRSVHWAARVFELRIYDNVTAARTLTVLDILLSKLHLETAVECVQETEEAWEELDSRGGGGAVSSGTLRERDLIALLRAFPLQQLLANLTLFSQADFRQATEYDWGDASGGDELLKSCYGVRVLLSILQRAVTLHPLYERLHEVLRGIACSALTSLACLYWSPRAPYFILLEETITAELEAAFAAGFTLFGTLDLHKLPVTLLSDQTAKDYCSTFIIGLHDESPRMIESLSVEAPVLPCGVRIRIITHAAINRDQDHGLARAVLEFLLQTALKRKSVPCKAGCESAARECVPLLLTTHPHLRALALRTVADDADTLDPSSTMSVLQVDKWRPRVDELQATLQDWSKRCPALLQHLLLQLDYTPYTGLPLAQQLHIGGWLCSWSGSSPAALETAWRVLLRLRTHRACWPLGDAGPTPAAPDPEPADLFSMAYAVLSSEWGHSVPLICSVGVNAILTLCATRPREAVHCLAPVMLMLTLTPESISLTPKFTELFTILLNCGPNLVQRAFGRGGASGAELLLRLVLAQVGNIHVVGATSLLPVWIHALWRVPAALSILDIAALASRDWYALDMHADLLLQQDPNTRDIITTAVRFAFTSPLLCESILKVAHAHEVRIQLFPRLISALYQQRMGSQRIHVDKALQSINAGISSEDLVIYKCASAALVAPFQHPSHLTLWRLFFHIYLQRPSDLYDDTAPPCGPLFFSGLIKSRVISQIRKRLIETATYHHNEAETYKNDGKKQSNPQPSTSNRVVRSESDAVDNSLLPALTIADLTGEPESDSDGDSDSENDELESIPIDSSTEEAIEVEKRRNANMAAYHTGAEMMIREFSRWVDEGENVRGKPAHAHIARFIPPKALDEAWDSTLSRCRPPPSADLDTFLRPSPAPPFSAEAPKTPLNSAVASILSVKCRWPVSESHRSRRTISPRVVKVEDEVYRDIALLMYRTDGLLEDMQKYAKEWGTEVSRISSVDSKLWEMVSALRVPRPLPPVKKQCANKCKPITFHLNIHEWCISAGAERGIRECRSASLTGIRRLTRPRPLVARTAADLHTIARRIGVPEHAVKILDLTWHSAGRCLPCGAVNSALAALFDALAQRWITHDSRFCLHMLSKGLANISTPLQETLCGSLVAPRGMQYCAWPDVYTLLLESDLPSHTLFSYLSRFEMNRWSEQANANQRHKVMFALLTAAQRFGADPVANSVLIELIGLHTVLLIKPQGLSWMLMESLRISANGVLPPVYWDHLLKATETHAKDLTFDDLSSILHGIGSVWYVSGSVDVCERHATFAPCVANLLSILIRAYVAAAIKLTFEPDRVGYCTWTAICGAWTPWVNPNSILPHPAVATPGTGANTYTAMLKRFTACIRQAMRDCPGSENTMLHAIYFWVVKTFHVVETMETSQKPRAKLSALLKQLAKLPWCDQQWFTSPSVMTTYNRIQDHSAMNEELARWCCARFQATKAETLLVNVDKIDVSLPNILAILLQLFAANLYIDNPEFLKEGAKLPWWHLTEQGLLDGLIDFFKVHYTIEQPYHEKPQSNVILHAAELFPHQQYSGVVHRKRQLLVTEWTKAASIGPLKQHRAAFTQFMIQHITKIDAILEKPEEPKDLLYRLVYLTHCESEDEASTVVPAWRHWICEIGPAHVLPACVDMAAQITVLRIAAPIADDAIRMHLHNCEGGWAEIRKLWSKPLFLARHHVEVGALHAAYASVPQRAPPADTLTHLQALTHDKFNFIKNDAIVAVWICYAARVAWECGTMIATETTAATSATEAKISSDVTSVTAAANEDTPSASEIEECRHAALSLLTAWGQQQRRSILKVVTLQADIERPTVRHRTLVRLAECILTPSPEALQAYESICSSLSGFTGDVTEWGRAPSLRKLARLAGRLYPAAFERYFLWELDQAPGE